MVIVLDPDNFEITGEIWRIVCLKGSSPAIDDVGRAHVLGAGSIRSDDQIGITVPIEIAGRHGSTEEIASRPSVDSKAIGPVQRREIEAGAEPTAMAEDDI